MSSRYPSPFISAWLAAIFSSLTGFFALPIALGDSIGPGEVFLHRSTDPVLGNNIYIPTGIETDHEGNVFVYDSTSSGMDLVRKYTPQRQFLGAVQVHSPYSIAVPGGYLARDPNTGLIFMLLTEGEMRVLNPINGQMSRLFDLRALNIDTSTVYDVATSRSLEYSGGLIVPPFQWGDFAVLARGNRVDFFISGKAPAHTFLARVRVENAVIVSAKALVFSQLTTAGNVNLTRGVAVSPAGIVLTTVPVLTERGAQNVGEGPLATPIPPNEECQLSGTNCFSPAPSSFETCTTPDGSACSVIVDAAVAFAADFEPSAFLDPQAALNAISTCNQLPCDVPVVLLDRPESAAFDPIDLTSLGMAADARGNFYIATGPVGSSQCGFHASGALVMLPASLNFLTCAPVSDAPVNTSVDVAVTPDQQRVYMTLANLGMVATFSIVPLP